MAEWTKEEFDEFEQLVDKACSPDHMDRINSRVDMPVFIEKHGRDKCDKMYAVLTANDTEN